MKNSFVVLAAEPIGLLVIVIGVIAIAFIVGACIYRYFEYRDDASYFDKVRQR